MMKDLYQHFSHEDREFIDRSLELLQRVQDTYAFETTSFLNPHQVSILKNIGKQYDVQVFASSGYYPSELARVLVAPSYYQLNMDDFELSLHRKFPASSIQNQSFADYGNLAQSFRD